MLKVSVYDIKKNDRFAKEGDSIRRILDLSLQHKIFFYDRVQKIVDFLS